MLQLPGWVQTVSASSGCKRRASPSEPLRESGRITVAPRPVQITGWASAAAPRRARGSDRPAGRLAPRALRGRLASPSAALRLETSLELSQQSGGGVPGAQALFAPLALALRFELSEAMTRLAQHPRPLPPRNTPPLLDRFLEVAETAAHPPREVAQGRRKLLLEPSQRARVAGLCTRCLLRRAFARRAVAGGVRSSRRLRRCQDESSVSAVPMQSACPASRGGSLHLLEPGFQLRFGERLRSSSSRAAFERSAVVRQDSARALERAAQEVAIRTVDLARGLLALRVRAQRRLCDAEQPDRLVVGRR